MNIKTDSELYSLIMDNFHKFIEEHNLTQEVFFNETNAHHGEFVIDFDPADYYDWLNSKLKSERPLLATIVFDVLSDSKFNNLK